MPEFNIRDKNTGMVVTVRGDQPPREEILPEIFANARKQSAESLASGDFKLREDLQHLDKAGQRNSIRKHSARALGVSEDDIDIDSGMGMWDRAKLSFQPTEAEKMKQLEDTYGKENVSMLNIGGSGKMFYRDPKTKKMTMVDEMGASLADFTADIAGDVAPTAASIAGAVGGFAVGGVPGSIGGAAVAGGLARGAQDVATAVLSDEEIQGGEIASRAAKEAATGAVIDTALFGAGKFIAKPFLSKMTGDATARAFGEVADDLPEGALTPRMMQGEEALTREVGMESKVGGRVGDARKAIDERARQIVSEADPVAYDRYAASVTRERDELLQAIPANEQALKDRVQAMYERKLQGFGAGDGRTLGEIGKDIIENSTSPALKAARAKKNRLYTEFDTIDQEIGGVFTPREIVKEFDTVLSKNRLKSNSAIQSIKRELNASKEPFTIGEVDDLISRVTDAMPDGVVKDKTAQQLAAELSDSLSKIVRRKAKQYPELQSAWSEANKYYKNTFLRFNRGSVGGVTREVSGDASLSPKSFIKNILSDAREVDNVLAAAREGGQSPSVVRSRLKEAFLANKGIQKGASVRSLTLSPNDMDVVKALWGSRGLKRLQSIEKSLKASPEQLDEYLGALSDNQARDIRKELVKQSKDIQRLESIQKNEFRNKLAEGKIPSGQDAAISKAFLSMSHEKRKAALNAMDEGSREHLRGVVGAQVMFDGVDTSPFRDAMGEHLFNGTAALGRLNRNKDALIDVLGAKEYKSLKDLAVAQDKLKPLDKGQAAAKLRTLAGGGGISFYIVGDIISSVRDKIMSLAYRTKALDPLMSGWSKLDEKSLNVAMRRMLYGAQSKKALDDADDPELDLAVDSLRQAFPEG